jgi:secreted trypsin-like serine protease
MNDALVIVRERHLMSRKLLVVGTLLAFLLVVTAVSAVTWGVPDGDGHPHVGLLVFDVNGFPAWRCSGTLLSPTVVLTAGHCTFGASSGRIWFDADVGAGRPGNGYPFAGGTGIEFAEIYTHPDYNPGAFYMHDVGVVILSQPVASSTYGVLADIGLLDQLSTRRGLQEQLFTVVGYGLQEVVPNPNEIQADLVRYRATNRLIDVRGTAGIPAGTSVMFTNNPGAAARGGTCSGDSGGPTFWGESNIIAAVTSFGLNPNCVGNGGGYRVDTADDQAFINQFLP